MAARILFVTGKGGTGKSSVAEALAAEAASRSVGSMLVRMPASSSAVRPSPPGVVTKLLDDTRDLEDFLSRVIGLGFLARRLLDSATFSAVAAAAPGLRDLVALTAITTEASYRRGLVVVDAPASGHSVSLLTAPAQVLDLAPMGPIAHEARAACAVLADARQFTALVVATPEELAITEALQLREDIKAAGVPAPRLIVNGLWPAHVCDGDGEAIAASGASADATAHWRRHRRQAALLTDLEDRAGPCSHIGFAFAAEGLGLSKDDVAALYTELMEGA